MSLEERRDRVHRRVNALSTPLVELLGRVGVTPDALTVTGLVLSSAAAACLAGGAVRIAGLVWLLASTLDLLDGALARRQGMAARKGAFLDSSLDRISEGLLLTAAVYYFAHRGMEVSAAASAYALLVSFMVSYTRARAEALGVVCRNGLATRPERVLLIAVGLVFDILVIAVAVLALLATITTVQRLAHVRLALSDARDAPLAGARKE